MIATEIIATGIIARPKGGTKLHTLKSVGGLTSGPNSGKNYLMVCRRMSDWRISPASVFLLAGLIVLMLLIVLIPDDVDLPDAAFHRGTAPLAVHALATSAPLTIIIATALSVPSAPEVLVRSFLHWDPELYPVPNFRPILLRTIRR